MINRIIEFCARNKFIVFLFVGAGVLGGWWALKNVSLDAIPDLSDTQVIIYSRWDRSPDIIEDQVTYSIITAMRLPFTHAKPFGFRPKFLSWIVNALAVGKIHSEGEHPISRLLIRLYHPVAKLALRFKWTVVLAAIAVVAFTLPVMELVIYPAIYAIRKWNFEVKPALGAEG